MVCCVSGENKEDWMWSLDLIIDGLGLNLGNEYILMSDQHKNCVQYLYLSITTEREKMGLVKRIRNKDRFEGSIVRENLVYKLATYCFLYVDPTTEAHHNRESILYANGQRKIFLTHNELYNAPTYFLLNSVELTSYIISDGVAPYLYLYDEWYAFEHFRREPTPDIVSHNGYFVNGYMFHTKDCSERCTTSNYVLCVKGEMYFANGHSTIVMFKGTWFDNQHGVTLKNG
ncbi:hypothetical protein LXL04_029568 [Taraxacum kok-saghyz]